MLTELDESFAYPYHLRIVFVHLQGSEVHRVRMESDMRVGDGGQVTCVRCSVRACATLVEVARSLGPYKPERKAFAGRGSSGTVGGKGSFGRRVTTVPVFLSL